MHADGRRTVIAGRAVLRVLWNGVLDWAGVPVEYEKEWRCYNPRRSIASRRHFGGG